MNNTFHYLKPFVLKRGESSHPLQNCLYPVYEKEIAGSEKRLGFLFPPELREFYLEIGCGFLSTSYKGEDTDTYSNRILDPFSIADILLEGVDSGQLHPEASFRPGEMPFFEIGEMRDFFSMYPLSDKPNAIYDNIDGSLVTDSFSKFIWRLYYESPTFYLNV